MLPNASATTLKKLHSWRNYEGIMAGFCRDSGWHDGILANYPHVIPPQSTIIHHNSTIAEKKNVKILTSSGLQVAQRAYAGFAPQLSRIEVYVSQRFFYYKSFTRTSGRSNKYCSYIFYVKAAYIVASAFSQ
jgi:hypothetical protein